MTAAMGPDRFNVLPLDLQKSITRFLSLGDTKDARVSKLFKKLMDDPYLWKALGDRMNFKIDLKTAKEDFIRQYDGPVFDVMIDRLFSDKEKEAIKKLPFPEQRAALEELIAENDNDSLNLTRLLYESIKWYPQNRDNTQWRAACFILRNYPNDINDHWRNAIFEASKYHLNIFKAYLECQRNKKISLSDVYFEHMRIMHFTHVGCVPVLLEMGVVPDHSHLARAIVEIACEKGNETEVRVHSVQERLQPILDYFKNNQKGLKEAMELADKLVAELKKTDPQLDLAAVHTMTTYEKSQEAKESLAKQVQAFIEANFDKK